MIPIENETEIMEKIYLWLVQYSPLGQQRILQWVSNRVQEFNDEKIYGPKLSQVRKVPNERNKV